MLQSSARLLLLLSLLQSRRFWTGSELAQRLDVTPRTLRRDIERLRTLGYPVDATAGVAGGYRLAVGATLPPLQLHDDEALAVSIALRTAAGSAVNGVEEAAIRALVKLERVLPARVRDRVHALRAAIAPLPRPTSLVDVNALCTLANACSEHLQVRFQYVSTRRPRTAASDARPSPRSSRTLSSVSRPPPQDQAIAERCVDPVGLVHSNVNWYLVAWDNLRDDWRTFRVDRIRGDIACGMRFAPRPLPEDGDLKAYVARSISLGGYSHRARIRLYASAREMRPRIPAHLGVLQAESDSHCMLLTGAHSVEGLASWLSWLSVEFEVEEPPELLDYLRQQHARLGRAVRRSSKVTSGHQARSS